MADCDEHQRRSHIVEESVEEEDNILFFDEDDIKSGLEECTKSLVGRLLADKPFSIGTVESAFGAIWGHPDGFRVMDHGDNIYQFFFAREVDALRIELGSPWLFKNYIIHLWRWRAGMKMEEEDFSCFPVWIQIWGLPEYCKTKELGEKIGRRIGEVREVEFFNVRGKESRILKIKVDLNATKVLKSRLKIAGPDKKPMEVVFKYERLGMFCNYCGHIGHENRTCSIYLEDKVRGVLQEDKIGPWIKAEQVGRKEEDRKENKDQNKPGGRWNGESPQRKPTPVSLLRSFSNLSVNENRQGNNPITGLANLSERAFSPKMQKEGDDRRELREVEDSDTLSITYNGISFEGRVGDMGTEAT